VIKRYFLAIPIAAISILFHTPSLRAEGAFKVGFVDKVYKDGDGAEHKYVVFIPHSYKAEKEYPVILFLHGSGETKGGSKQPIEVGLPPAIKKQEKSFPFITIIPQSEKRSWIADSADGKMALGILESVLKDFKTDKNRIYLTGLSMGGGGTWSLAAAFPDKWAAIVPVCGYGDAAEIAAKVKDIPCWCFLGDKDSAKIVGESRNLIKGIEAAGGKPKFTEYPGVGHNSWDKAYGTPELYEWLLQQKKK